MKPLDPVFKAAADAVEHAIISHLPALDEIDLEQLNEAKEMLLDKAFAATNDPTWAMDVVELEEYEGRR